MESFECKGVWWTPDNQDNKVAGILTFSQQNGFELKLIGLLPSTTDNNSITYHPIILGVADGKNSLVTLYSCSENNITISSSGLNTSIYLVQTGFFGLHITNEESLTFDKAYLRFNYLQDWVNISGIKFSYDLNESNKYQVSYTVPPEISINTSIGKIAIDINANVKQGFDLSHLNENTTLCLEGKSQFSFHTLSTQFIFPLQALINFGTSKLNFVVELLLIKNDYPKNPIKVLYRQKFYKTKVKERLHDTDMLFSLKNIFEDFEAIVEKWLILSQEIDNVFNLYFRVKRASDTFLELRFLSIAQALESFHRRKRVNNVLPKKAQERRIREITNSVPEEYKNWLKNALAYTNEKSLKIRLEELFDETEFIMYQQITDKEKFIKLVRDTRNYLTHYNKKMLTKTATGIRLLYLVEKLSFMLDSCLLNELGISQEKQITFFETNDYFNQLKDVKLV